MSIKSLLVHVEASHRARQELAPVLGLARDQQAKVTGLFPIAGLEPIAAFYGERSAAYRTRLAEAQTGLQDTERWFLEEAKKQSVEADWLTGEGDAASVTTMASRYFDLTIAARDAPSETIGWNVVEEVLLSGGRPCLALPPGYDKAFGSRVLVGWTASRESSRALATALPILQRAAAVTVLIGPPRDRFAGVRAAPDLDIAAFLKRHSIAAEIAGLDIADASAGRGLLEEAARRQADLLVMGAYGRSWAREWLLGGATRHVLHHATMPVLMSC